jgi:hypothetical protein
MLISTSEKADQCGTRASPETGMRSPRMPEIAKDVQPEMIRVKKEFQTTKGAHINNL